ncbi:hypothetical protein ACEI87_09900 [Clostridioides difficile]
MGLLVQCDLCEKIIKEFKVFEIYKLDEKEQRIKYLCEECYNKTFIDKINNDEIPKKRKFKYPCIYKHFKGKYYATMGISKPISRSDFYQ